MANLYSTIALTNGGSTIIDWEDYSKVSKLRWHKVLVHSSCISRDGDHTSCKWQAASLSIPSIRMSRFILDITSSKTLVDHKNGDTLDNRRENIRAVTVKQNGQNRSTSFSSKTGVRGVSARNGGFRAQVYTNGQQHYLGDFKSLDDAKQAVLAGRLKYFTHSDGR